MPAFTVSGGCSITYIQSVVGPTVSSDTSFFTPVTNTELQWYTADGSNMGTYTVTVTATSGCSIATATYTVDVLDACSVDSLTIDATKFANPALTYNVRAPMETLSWTDSHVSSDNGLTDCGALVWTVTQTDSITPIEGSVFTTEDLSDVTKTLDVYTEDYSKAQTYAMRVTVSYSSYPAVTAQLDFTVLVQDYCETDVVITMPSAFGSVNYSIGETQIDL